MPRWLVMAFVGGSLLMISACNPGAAPTINPMATKTNAGKLNANELLDLGLTKHEMEKYDEAIQHYTEALRLDPAMSDALHYRGVTYVALKEFDKAIDDFNAALKLEPEMADLYYNRGTAWDWKNDYTKAIADYRTALEISDRNFDAHSALAWLLATCPDTRFRDGPSAILHATKACELDSWENADLLDVLAAAFAESGDFAKAMEWETKAIELTTGELKKEFSDRLDLYRKSSPYRDHGK